MEKLDKGSVVMIEVEFKKAIPFAADEYFDPTTPKITIKDSLGTVKISEQLLVKASIGKWYAICQTQTSWKEGSYSAIVVAVDGTYTGIDVDPKSFELI